MLLRNILLFLLFILYSIQSSLHVQHRGEVKPLDILFEAGHNVHKCVSQKNDSISLSRENDSISLFRELQMQWMKLCLDMQVGINYFV
jgi:hypothetical protein